MSLQAYSESWKQQSPISLVLRVISESVLLTVTVAIILILLNLLTLRVPFRIEALYIILLLVMPVIETFVILLGIRLFGKIIGIRIEILILISYLFIFSLYVLYFPSFLVLCGIVGGIYFAIYFNNQASESLTFALFNTAVARLVYFSVIVGVVSLLSSPKANIVEFPGKTESGFLFFKNKSQSMVPSIHQNDLIVVRAAYYNKSPLLQGDVALIQYDQMYPEPLLKRVVGLPGDTISIQQGQLLVNSTVQPEPYVDEHNTSHVLSRRISAQVVPAGHIFVLGDNRDNSYDSRYWGPLPDTVLIGKAQYILWSDELARIGAL
ncbi:MAG: signal peptidase I, partial [Candidatus Marinimicrobia bacterium]|nr:signal peptidase I [Candidatus Neomarinimicrobiota bacterium]